MLLGIVAVTVALAVAAAVALTVLLGDSGTTTTPDDSTWDRSGCGGAMTVTFLRPIC
jgi:hypothetical protein